MRTIDVYYNLDRADWCDASGALLPRRYDPTLSLRERVILRMRVVDSLGQAVSSLGGLDFTGAAYDGFASSRTKVMEILASDVNASEDWASANASLGLFSLRLNADVSELATALTGKRSERYWLEVTGASASLPHTIIAGQALFLNKFDMGGTSPSPLPATDVTVGTAAITNGADSVAVLATMAANTYPVVTLVAPTGSVLNIGIANTIINGTTGFTVYLTSPVPEEGWSIKYAIIQK